MASFVLVHGGWHGGWCWDLLSSELEKLGHHVVAPDMPAEDPSAGASRYCEVVEESLTETGDDLIVVGHSLGGLVIPIVATRRPVRSLVFLCAMVPLPGRAFLSTIDSEGPQFFSPEWPSLAARQHHHQDGSSSWPEEAAIEAFYEECEPEIARSAAARLRRQCWGPLNEPSPLDKWPQVNSVCVIGANDRAVNPEWGRLAAQDRLGVEAIELESDHSPMLSRPKELAAVLDEESRSP